MQITLRQQQYNVGDKPTVILYIYVKKGKRGACEQKAATVLPNRTAAA